MDLEPGLEEAPSVTDKVSLKSKLGGGGLQPEQTSNSDNDKTLPQLAAYPPLAAQENHRMSAFSPTGCVSGYRGGFGLTVRDFLRPL